MMSEENCIKKITGRNEANDLLFLNYHVCRVTIVFGRKLYRSMMVCIKYIAINEVKICANPSMPSVLWKALVYLGEVSVHNAIVRITHQEKERGALNRAVVLIQVRK
jgi:hypothetical protein